MQRWRHAVGRSRSGLSLWLTAGLMFCSAASAQTPSPENLTAAELKARSLAATCAACHGTDGRPTADQALPALAGRSAKELSELLHAFQSGTRAGTVMPQLAKGYDDAQIELLARYFSTRPVAEAPKLPQRRPTNQRGTGTSLGTRSGATP